MASLPPARILFALIDIETRVVVNVEWRLPGTSMPPLTGHRWLNETEFATGATRPVNGSIWNGDLPATFSPPPPPVPVASSVPEAITLLEAEHSELGKRIEDLRAIALGANS